MNANTLIHTPDGINIQNPHPDASSSEEKSTVHVSPTAEELYNAIFNNAFQPMFIGTGTGKIVKFNEKFSGLFGYSKDEMDEKEISDLFEIDEPSFVYFMKQREEKGIEKAEITGIKKFGNRFPCRISSVLYESDNGKKRSMNTVVNISQHISARWTVS